MLRQLRRIVIAVGGGLVVAVGVAMLVLPGPAIVVIPAGLAILATEFQWARRLLHRVRERLKRGLSLFKRRPPPPTVPSQFSGKGNTQSAPGDPSRASELRAS